jgi:ADP-ribosylation factor-like protein 2
MCVCLCDSRSHRSLLRSFKILIFLKCIWQIKQNEKEIRLLILGLDNAGKTTVLRKFCGESIDQIEPTLGFNIQTLCYSLLGDDKAGGYCSTLYQLNFWDVGGQKSIRAYWRNYFEQTDGLIWVVDSADRMRLDLCRNELAQLLSQERLAGASLLILANKQDVPGALTVTEIAQVLQLDCADRYQNRHWSIHACSAVTGDGLREAMDWTVQDIGNRIFMMG